MASDATPAWDQEATLSQARAQVRLRVDEHVLVRGAASHWIGGDAAADLDVVARLGDGAVIGSDLMLSSWSEGAIGQLSIQLRRQNGILVFVEPTAGFGWRRLAQLVGRKFRRDVPALLRRVGFSVTTQVRLRHSLAGEYVRGEAQHYGTP